MAAKVDFSALANPSMRNLQAYDPGHDIPGLRMRFAGFGGLCELGSNENCYGPSGRVYPALAGETRLLHRYPDPSGKSLKSALSGIHDIDPDQIILGNGSHELLMQLAQVFAGPGDEVLVSRYCFAVYPIATKAAGAQLVVADELPLTDEMPLGHDLSSIAVAISPKTKLIFFANPNNPTGTWFTSEAFERFMAQVPQNVLVVADEAYIEYVTDSRLHSAMRFRKQFPNLIVSRTFSKAYGLAGLRAGYLVADASVVQRIEPIRESFNLNAFALAGAEAALSDTAHLVTVRDGNEIERTWLRIALSGFGFSVLPSQTNFLLVRFGERTADIEQGLLNRGIVVRPMAGYGLSEYLRVTVSNRLENQRLLLALSEIES